MFYMFAKAICTIETRGKPRECDVEKRAQMVERNEKKQQQRNVFRKIDLFA